MGGSDEAAAAEAKAWTEVFTLFQQTHRDDRGAAYAMSMGALRRKCEDLDARLEAVRFLERRLLQFARADVQAETREAAAQAAGSAPQASRVFGQRLAANMVSEVQRTRGYQKLLCKPWQAAVLADDAHEEAADLLETQQREQEERDIRTKAEAKAQAQALQEAEEKVSRDVGEQTRLVLARQGLNTKRLPLRPGHPPCGYFLRRGSCKRLKTCMWDHPEPELNSHGFPLRPGALPCAPYHRTQTCKFGVLCMYDHPEPEKLEVKDTPGQLPLSMEKVAAQLHQAQLLLHLQLLQETDLLQDPEAMMNAWVRFRMTFCSSG